MSPDPDALARVAAWTASGVGLSLWLWSWFAEKDAIRRVRMMDCGLVLVSGGVLLRIVVQERPMNILDWAMVFLAPLFIAAALWRLARTGCPPGGR